MDPLFFCTANIQYSDFIRTTEDRHVKIVQNILNEVHKNGDIYQDEYEGWYSVAEERFITDKELDSGLFREAKKIKERNYFFKMSTRNLARSARLSKQNI